jgi:hypothetical protein
MADIEIAGNTLIVHVRGADRFLALRSQLEVPLEHVASVEVNPQEAHGIWHGLRMGGTNVPRVITAGNFVQHGEWAFWDVHDPSKAIAIQLHDEGYARLVIGVDDPEGTALAIRTALAGLKDA